MIFGYQRKLGKYRKCMDFLNSHVDETRKVINLLRYARENELTKYNVNILGELEAIFYFYYVDILDMKQRIDNCNTNSEKDYYLNRIEDDQMILNEIGEGARVKPILAEVYKNYRKVELLEPIIKPEDKILLNTNNGIKR